MKKNVVMGALLALLLILALVAIERCHVTEEERVEAAWNNLVTAMQDEDAGRMRAAMSDQLDYEGPRPIGEGDKLDAMLALAGYWIDVEQVAIITRTNEIQVQGSVATTLTDSVLRFRWSGSLVIYRVKVQVAWIDEGGTWKARDIEILELTPGLFGG